MLRKIIFLLIITFTFTSPSYADITIQEIENVPLSDYYVLVPAKYENESTDKIAVVEEVRQLQKVLSQKKYKWIVNIVKQRATILTDGLIIKSGTQVYGAAGWDKNAYIFSYPVISSSERGYFDAHVIAHEIGHLVRFDFISIPDLWEYVGLRKDGNEHYTSSFDNPEELFAEDFRWLFGSEKVREEYYKPTYPEPGEKERQWILAKINEEIKPKPAVNTIIVPKPQPKPKITSVKKPTKMVKHSKFIKKVTKNAHKSR